MMARRSEALIMPLGLILVGVSGFAFLGIVGYRFGPTSVAPLAVLWTVANIVGTGICVPLEQELVRRLASNPGLEAIRHRVIGAAIRSALIFVVFFLVIAVVFGSELDRIMFSDNSGIAFCCAATAAGFAVQHVWRGVFAADGDFVRYGVQLIVDGSVRLGGSVCLLLAGDVPLISYGVVLAVAPWVSLIVSARITSAVLPWALHSEVPGWTRNISLLLAGQAGSTLIIGIGPMAATVISSGSDAVAVAELIGVLTLARVPLLGLYALQARLLPALTRLVAESRLVEFARRVSRLMCGVLLATAVTCVGAWVLGPLLVRSVLGPGFEPSGVDVATVATATMLYIGAAIVCQAMLAVRGHWLSTASWSCGLVCYVSFLLAPWSATDRVKAGFFGASLVTLLVAAFLLRQRCRSLLKADVLARV